MCRAVILAVVFVCVASVARATTPPPFPPPARFDHAFKGTHYVAYADAWTVLWRCGIAYACTPIGGEAPKRCTTIILRIGDRPVFGGYRIDRNGWRWLWRHETGHCNGWPANHPK